MIALAVPTLTCSITACARPVTRRSHAPSPTARFSCGTISGFGTGRLPPLGAREGLDERREIGARIDEQIVDPVGGKRVEIILGGHPALHRSIHRQLPELDPRKASAERRLAPADHRRHCVQERRGGRSGQSGVSLARAASMASAPTGWVPRAAAQEARRAQPSPGSGRALSSSAFTWRGLGGKRSTSGSGSGESLRHRGRKMRPACGAAASSARISGSSSSARRSTADHPRPYSRNTGPRGMAGGRGSGLGRSAAGRAVWRAGAAWRAACRRRSGRAGRRAAAGCARENSTATPRSSPASPACRSATAGRCRWPSPASSPR